MSFTGSEHVAMVASLAWISGQTLRVKLQK